MYFFFNHSDREQTAVNIIKVLLRQLLDQLKIIPIDVRNEYSRYKNDPHKIMPDRDKYKSMLKSSIEEFFKANGNRVFILIDAYDELLSTKEDMPESAAVEREAVRSCLSGIIESDNAKILVTTRRHYREELEKAFPKSKVVDIHGDPNDMRTYLEIRMKTLSLDADKKKEIMNTLLKANEEGRW